MVFAFLKGWKTNEEEGEKEEMRKGVEEGGREGSGEVERGGKGKRNSNRDYNEHN